jgi:phage portal protein BeeE
LRLPWRKPPIAEVERSTDPLSFDEFLSFFNFNGVDYPLGSFAPRYTLGSPNEEIASTFAGYVQGIYRSNGVVFACMAARARLFSEARFQFRQMRNGRPGDLFGTDALGVLEQPWLNATTGDLLSRMIQDVDLGGNACVVRDGKSLRRLHPEWVTIIAGSATSDNPNAPDAEPIGYIYEPGGKGRGDAIHYMPEVVAHWTAPGQTDPLARFLGMSWLTPILRETQADSAAMSHKLQFFRQGATPNLAISMDPSITPETFERYVELHRQNSEGVANAYKTLFVAGGTTVTPVGADMRQIDFKTVQGHGETRIASAAGVPPIIVGLSEGLEAATYSNYGMARRAFADGTMRPLWRSVCGALEKLVPVPGGAHLWYDDRDIAFLQEDQKDAADIQSVRAATIHTLIAAGFDPDTVIDAVNAEDFSRLTHTGMFSVQLQPAGTITEGKGSVVQGVPAAKQQKQLPASTQASAQDVVQALHRAA